MKSIVSLAAMLIACSCFAQEEKKTYSIEQLAKAISSNATEGWAKSNAVAVTRLQAFVKDELLTTMKGQKLVATNVVFQNVRTWPTPISAEFVGCCKIDKMPCDVKVTCLVTDKGTLDKLERTIEKKEDVDGRVSPSAAGARPTGKIGNSAKRSMKYTGKAGLSSVEGAIKWMSLAGPPKCELQITIENAVLK